MLRRYRRDAAVLATYLAQFTEDRPPNQDRTAPHRTATSLTDHELAQRRRDHTRALHWSVADDLTDVDIAALAQMRIFYGFPPTR